jgi:hypothetical protein
MRGNNNGNVFKLIPKRTRTICCTAGRIHGSHANKRSAEIAGYLEVSCMWSATPSRRVHLRAATRYAIKSGARLAGAKLLAARVN